MSDFPKLPTICFKKPRAIGGSVSEIPRRDNMLEWVPAELAIKKAMDAVEEMGASTRLTDAVIYLEIARDAVADFVDGKCPHVFNKGPAYGNIEKQQCVNEGCNEVRFYDCAISAVIERW